MASRRKGMVYLVGAGPGDPALLTVRARDVLGIADILIYDEEIDSRILDLTRKSCERVPVASGRGGLTLDGVCQLLVDRAATGRTVVRLRLGDPYISGRGSEEALGCMSNDVRFETIPGVDPALAAPGIAGIPLLQSGLSGSLSLVRGPLAVDIPEEAPSEPDPVPETPRRPGVHIRRRKKGAAAKAATVTNSPDAVTPDWPSLCSGADTLVFLRMEHQVEALRDGLLAGGRSESEPVAAIGRGVSTGQTTVVTTVGEMLGKLGQSSLQSPVVIVVGDVVNLRECLDLTRQKELSGFRLGIATSREWPDDWVRQLAAEGIAPSLYRLCLHRPTNGLREEIGLLADDFRCADYAIFTSENAVRILGEEFAAAQIDWRLFGEGCEFVAMGRETGYTMESFRMRCRTAMPIYAPRALSRQFSGDLQGKRLLIFCESLCDRVALQDLRERGASVTEIPLCESLPMNDRIQELSNDLRDEVLDCVLFDSAQAVELFMASRPPGIAAESLSEIMVASIDEATTHALLERGAAPLVESESPDAAGICTLLLGWRRDPASVSFGTTPMPEDDW